MPPDALDRLERLFRAARMHPPGERTAFLEAACADDPALRREVESLLAADAGADDGAFLDTPATGLLGDLPADGDGADDPLVGASVGPYRVLRPLGEGGMGTVYLAVREAPFLQHVALKVIRGGLSAPDVLRRFEQERQILASLNHPGIARLLDGGMTEDGGPYFAMEYVEGRPITTYADEHRLGIEERIGLFRAACEAVHYAHQNLVLHRDLKPSNILVTAANGPDGGPSVKLLDFGIAKLLNPNLSPAAMPATRTALRALTPEYASPEQVRGEPLTTASDVYSLGVILYELLAGHRPYHLTRGTPDELVRAVCEQDPERPSAAAGRRATVAQPDGSTREVTPGAVSEARDTTPEKLRRRLRGDLDTIALMALRKEPQRRYPSAEALGHDLDRYRHGSPVLAHRDTRRYRFGKLVRRHRAETALVVVVAAAVVGFALFSSAQARRVAEERDRARHALAASEQVRAFLVDLFRAADPTAPGGVATTTGELLARGAERAEALADQPGVQADVLAAVGEVYLSLGEYARAERLLARAVALRRATRGPRHPAVAQALLLLGDALRGQSRFAGAEGLYRQALGIQRAHYGGRHPVVAETLDRLGGIRTYRSDLDEAEAFYRESLAIRRATLGPDDPAIAQSLHLTALLLRRRGDHRGALEGYRRALALRQRIHGPGHPETALAMLHLGDQYLLMGRDAEAGPLFREALRLNRAAYGPDHPALVHGLHSLADFLERRGEFAAAEALLRESLALARRVYGGRSWRVAAELNHLGAHMRRRGALDAAEALHREALALYDETLDPSERYALGGRLHLADVLRDRGAYGEAETLYREVLALRIRAEGPGTEMVARDMTRLADVLVLQGALAEADTLYHHVLRLRQPAIADAHEDIQHVLRGLVALYEAQGRGSEAAPYRERLVVAERANR